MLPTVLVADDDEWMRTMIEVMLEMEGFQVVLAENGQQALAILQSTKGIDVILTDVQMPGMDGLRFASKARQCRPELPLLFMSAGVSEVPGELVPKPFSPDEVAGRLRTAIGAA